MCEQSEQDYCACVVRDDADGFGWRLCYCGRQIEHDDVFVSSAAAGVDLVEFVHLVVEKLEPLGHGGGSIPYRLGHC